MITATIQIKEYLAEYAYHKFGVENESFVRFPDTDYLYHVVYNLMDKRPIGTPADFGNLQIALPNRSRGKNPQSYNYICATGIRIIEKKIELRFWAELHDFVDERVHVYGEQYNASVFLFMKTFGITGITEDALIKNYYRWRSKTRRKIKKRKYTGITKKSG